MKQRQNQINTIEVARLLASQGLNDTTAETVLTGATLRVLRHDARFKDLYEAAVNAVITAGADRDSQKYALAGKVSSVPQGHAFAQAVRNAIFTAIREEAFARTRSTEPRQVKFPGLGEVTVPAECFMSNLVAKGYEYDKRKDPTVTEALSWLGDLNATARPVDLTTIADVRRTQVYEHSERTVLHQDLRNEVDEFCQEVRVVIHDRDDHALLELFQSHKDWTELDVDQQLRRLQLAEQIRKALRAADRLADSTVEYLDPRTGARLFTVKEVR